MTDTVRWNVPEPSQMARQSALARQAELTKPTGSLGRLEELAVEIAAWQATDNPESRPAGALLFASDHPVAAQGVSAFPPAVTPAMVLNFVHGGAAASVLCRALSIPLSVVDVGVQWPAGSAHPSHPALVRDEVADDRVGDIRSEDAMSSSTFVRAVAAGANAIDRLGDVRVVMLGDMGIGNTTVASCVCAALLGGDPASFVGSGTGVLGEVLEHKRRVVADAVARLHGEREPHEVVRRVGGRDIAALFGAMARAAERRTVVLVDGFIVTAAALALVRADPRVRSALVFAHRSSELAHGRVLEALAAHPLVDLGLRLGEASGALTAYPLLELACAVHANMATFESARVPKRSDEG